VAKVGTAEDETLRLWIQLEKVAAWEMLKPMKTLTFLWRKSRWNSPRVYSRRLDWDTFLREARRLNNAQVADRGIPSRCVARWAVGGLRKVAVMFFLVRVSFFLAISDR
jgi:hypothetical protein